MISIFGGTGFIGSKFYNKHKENSQQKSKVSDALQCFDDSLLYEATVWLDPYPHNIAHSQHWLVEFNRFLFTLH